MSMNLQQWLEIQGAGKEHGPVAIEINKSIATILQDSDGFYFFAHEKIYAKDLTFSPSWKLYAWDEDDVLLRVDKPIIHCSKCKTAGLRDAEDWLVDYNHNAICPECQTKTNKPEKLRVKPCWRCGSKNIIAIENSICPETEPDTDIICGNCGIERCLPEWNKETRRHSVNITDQIEVINNE